MILKVLSTYTAQTDNVPVAVLEKIESYVPILVAGFSNLQNQYTGKFSNNKKILLLVVDLATVLYKILALNNDDLNCALAATNYLQLLLNCCLNHPNVSMFHNLLVSSIQQALSGSEILLRNILSSNIPTQVVEKIKGLQADIARKEEDILQLRRSLKNDTDIYLMDMDKITYYMEVNVLRARVQQVSEARNLLSMLKGTHDYVYCLRYSPPVFEFFSPLVLRNRSR